MAKQRCSKHPFYYEPCSVCTEIKEFEDCLKIQDEKILELEDLTKEQRQDLDVLIVTGKQIGRAHV